MARELLARSKTQEDKKKWSTVPCRVIKGELKREEIDQILCNYHIKKKRDWEPYEKACYFSKMYEENITQQMIANMTESSQPLVGMYIGAYKIMRKMNAEKNEFSHYLELYKQSEARDIIVNDKKKLTVFAEKIKTGKIKDAQEVRKLTVIMKDTVAEKNFFNKPNVDIKRAEEIAIRRHPEEGDKFLRDLEDLKDDIRSMPLENIESISNDKKKIKIIKTFFNEIKKFVKQIGIKI